MSGGNRMGEGGACDPSSPWSVVTAVTDIERREHLYDLLTQHGFSVITIPLLAGVVDLLRHERPAALLAEIPAGSGAWELVADIRAFDAALPIILLGDATEAPSQQFVARNVHAILPARAGDEDILSAVSRWLRSPVPTPRGVGAGTVLVVDDEPKLRSLLAEFFQRRAYTVLAAGSGEEALEQLRHRPDIVLLDVKMPGMDGLLTLRKIKAARPETVVIMTTAVDEETSMAQAFTFGAYEYVTKPYDFSHLESIFFHLQQLLSPNAL